MALFDFLRRASPPEPAVAASPTPPPRAATSAGPTFSGLDDPALLEFIRTGQAMHGGAQSLKNMAVLRCLALISESIGMLPLSLIEQGPDKRILSGHEAHKRMKLRPNTWQTPYEFKSGMQLNALVHGAAYARVVWSRGLPLHLIPMESDRVEAKLGDDWRMRYRYTRPDGGTVDLQQQEVFHLRDLSLDGVQSLSRIKLARNALGLAQKAETAASRVFEKGVMAGGSIEVPSELSDQAYKRMRESLDTDTAGAENAGRWMLLEEGAKAEKWSSTGKDAQHIENRSHQIEEVARAFGVPRPLLMMDETAWGSGIEQLGIFFVQYGLQHWFTAWEQALARVLLSDAEQERCYFKFNERALMRGTLKDQGDYFAKSLGAGGHAPWHTQNEVRSIIDEPRSDDPNADRLRNPMTQKGSANEPPQTP